MKFVYHVNQESAILMIDGRLLTIPPNEIFEVPEIRGTDCNNNGNFEYIIPDHQVLQRILEHGWYHGLVEVPVVRTKNSFTADIDSAKRLAADALQLAEDKILTRYVTDQQERTTKEGKPAIAPGGRVAMIVEKRGIDLKKEFNIDPPGYTVSKIADRDAEMAAMQKRLAELEHLLTETTKTKRER